MDATAARQGTSTAGQCVECHAEIAGQYSRSGMSHSWRAATPAAFAALPMPGRAEDAISGYGYDVVAREGELWQIETHRNDPAHRCERKASFLVGSGHHAVAAVAADHGFLNELPVGWFAQAGWRMNPGYELKNHRFNRPITSGCIACHATSAADRSPADQRFVAPIEEGIDCRRCHGEATEHVAYWKSPSDEPPPPKARMIDPGQWAAERSNDVCLQCHLQGDISVPIGGKSPFDFRAGDRLRDFRHDFLIRGQPETLGVASHGARLLQSRCYLASEGKLNCILCHDPHRPASDFPAEHYDAKCQTCHQPQACKRQATENRELASGGCVGCHMPQQPTREGIHLVFTDHAIRRRPSPQGGAQTSILAPDSEVELISTWPGEKTDEAELGAAYVLLHETMGPQRAALRLGREKLAAALLKDPADWGSRYWLGSALLALDRPAEARECFQKVLATEPARHEARFRLGLAEEAADNPVGAIAAYERLLVDAPDWPEPYSRLAQIYLSRQRAADAARILHQLIGLQPNARAYAALALAERLTGASEEQALSRVGTAIRLDSRESSAYVTRGALWLLSGETDKAQGDFSRALTLDPANAAARQALRGHGGP